MNFTTLKVQSNTCNGTFHVKWKDIKVSWSQSYKQFNSSGSAISQKVEGEGKGTTNLLFGNFFCRKLHENDRVGPR